MSRILAIGDIHGCLDALEALLAAIRPQPRDHLIFLGDYIDRGPDSRGVIDRLLQLRGECQLITLLGNHEVMLLEAQQNYSMYEAWRGYGGDATLASYGGHMDNIPQAHWDFYRELPIVHETAEHFFIHANYVYDLPLNEQPEEHALWEHVGMHTPAAHISGKTEIVGHTAQRSGKILDLGHLVCIDTYCHGGGWLTALDVENGNLWRANRWGELAE